MTAIKVTPVFAATLNLARNHSNDADRKAIKKDMFATLKKALGIPSDVKLKVNTTGVDQPGYLVLHDKNGNTFEAGADGRWVGATPIPDAVAPADTFGWYAINAVEVASLAVSAFLAPGDVIDDSTSLFGDNADYRQPDGFVPAQILVPDILGFGFGADGSTVFYVYLSDSIANEASDD